MIDINEIKSSAHVLSGASDDYDSLLKLVGDARFVLLGEATHGTHEFYRERALITQRLITELGFSAVAIEGDWPDAYKVNRYVCDQGSETNAKQALSGFERFPTWMWRNTEVVDFINWLRKYNDARSFSQLKVGFYGLDLYSLFTSMQEVLKYLDVTDPVAAKDARARYACFDHFQCDSQLYAHAIRFGAISESCESAVVSQLVELQKLQKKYLDHNGADINDSFFYAQQNARLVKNAEQYYRTMFDSRISSWNMRDRHMTEMLENLKVHLSKKSGHPSKIVIWAHNSHLGDARATEIGQKGELNVGQLMRQKYGDNVVLIGFTTDHGFVTAASDWNAPAERMRIRPALPGSFENIFHQTDIAKFMLLLRGNAGLMNAFSKPHLERAIGVIYLPESERWSHYFYANLAQQFDVILHFDKTSALEPLEISSRWVTGEAPETFPMGV